MFSKTDSTSWIEVNAKIVESVLTSNSWGTDSSHAKNLSKRRVKLTIEIPLTEGQVMLATRKFWTLTKNRNLFQEGKFITILYKHQNPKKFQLKYNI